MAKIRLGMAKLVELLWYLISLPSWKESQRLEYHADSLAVHISGKSAALSALEKLHFEPTFYIAFEKVAKYKYNNDLFGEFRNAVNHVPEREIKRIRRITQNAEYRFDTTHPPTALRKKYIEQCNAGNLALVLDPAREAEFEAEFRRLEQRIQRELLDDYRTWMAPYI
ncbi:hypothetical protein KZ483_15235 [Paenibacillus sp. sptzw28]|uniref:hypothetical protein n=1 Tax=Paenibacillus sp. sptzw28 TaxID=715179 RepID=UPI001C6EDD5C|nr:hypothetical protein [Paenibacillus sp. sptzw28]QYR19294.1 hypothetical protein KZ483_15235 [Paenibacillus sp. sptzw28]